MTMKNSSHFYQPAFKVIQAKLAVRLNQNEVQCDCKVDKIINAMLVACSNADLFYFTGVEMDAVPRIVIINRFFFFFLSFSVQPKK